MGSLKKVSNTNNAPDTEDVVIDVGSEAEEVKAETVDIATETEQESSEISITVDDSAKKAERLVAIKLSRSYSCSIGGTRYNFEPNKRYNVVADVKSILMREPNLLLPL